MDARIIVGLGNPGAMYSSTRHNVGYEVVDEICRRKKIHLGPGDGEYLFSEHRTKNSTTVYVKPLTYMNNSGEAVASALQRFEVSEAHMLVVVDDFALSLGSTRIRPAGRDGGHNGLRSIIYHLGSSDFPRLRCGIKRDPIPSGTQMSEFVLSPFEPDEKDIVHNMVQRAADACTEFATSGLEQAMNRFNTR